MTDTKHAVAISRTHPEIAALRQEIEAMLVDAMIDLAREFAARREKTAPAPSGDQ